MPRMKDPITLMEAATIIGKASGKLSKNCYVHGYNGQSGKYSRRMLGDSASYSSFKVKAKSHTDVVGGNDGRRLKRARRGGLREKAETRSGRAGGHIKFLFGFKYSNTSLFLRLFHLPL